MICGPQLKPYRSSIFQFSNERISFTKIIQHLKFYGKNIRYDYRLGIFRVVYFQNERL